MQRESLQVKSGFEFDHYFPKAKLITITKKKGATVADTLQLIPAVVRETLFHTKRFANEVIKADTLEKTCRNLWQFVYDHIAYKKDEDGKEQVRSPARAWHDRHNVDADGNQTGVDCDCYTVFISSVLSNLKIKHKLRITKYSENHFQHIYPIVPLENGRYITIDCVVRQFDYEEPYTEKKDTDMDLEYLNGVPDTNYKVGDSQDFMGLMGEQEALAELGKIFKRKAASGGGGAPKKGLFKRNAPAGGAKKGGLFKRTPSPDSQKKKGGKIKAFLKKGLHVTNRLNPAAATLRAGILAAMKINFMKIAEQIRYAYLTDEQAQQKGLLMDRFRKMKTIREKLEKIFYGAGGKPENLKKAILTGRGNRDKSVPMSGLGYVPYENVDGLNEDMPLSQLIGGEMYADEMHGVHGLGELGEPATAATIAAATTVLTTIVALIKSVGSLVPKKKNAEAGGGDSGGGDSGGSGDSGSGESGGESGGGEGGGESSSDSGSSDSGSDSASESSSDESTNGSTTTRNTPATTKTNAPAANEEDGGEQSDDGGSGTQNRSVARTTSDTSTKPTFWENNKKWIKPVGIGVGSLGLLALIYHLLKPKAKPMNGVPKRRRKKKAKGLLDGLNGTPKKSGNQRKRKNHPKGKKKVVTLL